jgi:hypothetical protein
VIEIGISFARKNLRMLANPPEDTHMRILMARVISPPTLLLVCVLAVCTSDVHAQGGIPLWTNRYHGVSSGRNGASGIALDSVGNVFVTGQSMGGTNFDFATIAYSAAGTPLWTNRYPSQESYSITPAIAADRIGNVFVTGPCPNTINSNADDYVTVAYSGDGMALWTNRFPAQAGHGNRFSIAVDGNGNVFISCPALNDRTNLEYAVLGYSSAGVPLWTNRYHGPGLYDQTPWAVAVDSSNGNVFVTGLTTGINDSATVAYSNSGLPLWTNHFGGYLVRVAVAGASGNVVVVGYPPPVGNNFEYATIAYSSDGLPLWTNIYAGPGNSYNIPAAIAVDKSGNVVVTGQATAGGWVYGTLAYSPTGIAMWTNLYAGPQVNDLPNAMALDSSGNVYVTGHASTALGWSGYGTLAYSSSGIPLWTNVYQGVPNGLQTGTGIVVDAAGSVFATGVSQSTNGEQEYATIKYSSSIQPYLVIEKANNQAVLTWTNAGFVLQSAAAVTEVFTNIPGAASPYTNSTADTERYFRLTTP